MARSNNNNNMLVSLLELVGGFLYLWVAFWGGSLSWFSTSGFIGPLLWGVGAIFAILLFLMALGSFMSGWTEDSMKMAMKAGEIAGIALLALAGNSGTNMLEVLAGFILSMLGMWLAMK